MRDEKLPVISIGLPVYNGETHIVAAINSILNQTFDNFELIVSDNCSTDATHDICESFASRDFRIRYHRNDRNVGAAANFNRVVELAQGKYFAWANHDDIWATTYFEECMRALETAPKAVLAYTKSAKVDASGHAVAHLLSDLALDAESPAERLRRFHDLFRVIDRRKAWGQDLIEGLWTPVYGLIRLNALRKTGLIGPYISSDTVLLEELLMIGSFVEVDEVLFFKRDHPQRSMRASVSYEKRIQWFTGRSGSRFLFPRWRLFWERLKSAMRVEMSLTRRLACLGEMLVFYLRRPHEGKSLVKEILINLQRVAPGRRRSEKAAEKW